MKIGQLTWPIYTRSFWREVAYLGDVHGTVGSLSEKSKVGGHNEISFRSVVHECIFVKKLDGTIIPIVCPLTETVGDVKRLISVIENIHPRRQRLYYGSKQLEDSKRLSQYDIAIGSTLHLCVSLRRTDAIRHYVDPKFRSPQFDYDFRNIDDSGIEFRRGGFVYMRPIGTYRIALNVLDRYGDNSWLGVNGRPSIFSEVPGEWAGNRILSVIPLGTI